MNFAHIPDFFRNRVRGEEGRSNLVGISNSWYPHGVNALEKRVAGDWFEVKERLHRPDELYDDLFPRDAQDRTAGFAVTASAAQRLEEAVEGGVFDVRRRMAGEILGELADAEYSSEVFSRLDALADEAAGLVLVGAVQRALLAGEISFVTGAGEAEPSGSSVKETENAEINEIVREIKEIVVSDPDANMNAAIKNILHQVQKYREEAATYKKLKEQANDFRLEMYKKTFTATFKEIFTSIRKNYATYIEEQEEKRRAAIGTPVDGLDVRPWIRMLVADLEPVSRMRSTIAYAAEERGGIRGALVALSRERDTYVARVERERAVATTACGTVTATAKLSRLLSVEIAAWLRGRLEE